MSTYFSPGSMANLSYDARETDFRIRITLGLPMVDDAGDFLGEFIGEIEKRDEEIADLTQKAEDADREWSREANEHGDTRRERDALTRENERLQNALDELRALERERQEKA